MMPDLSDMIELKDIKGIHYIFTFLDIYIKQLKDMFMSGKIRNFSKLSNELLQIGLQG